MYDDEHRAYGIPFPPLGERFDRLEEQLAIMSGMWSTPVGERFSFEGAHDAVTDSPALPKPVQSPLPIVIGGGGKERTPRLAARHATEFNLPFSSLDGTREQFERVRGACTEADRDPSGLVMSAAQIVCCGADEAEVKRRAAAIGRQTAELRQNGLAGTPAEVVDKLGRFAEVGTEVAYLQVLDLADLDHLRLVAEEVMPALR